ncbi:hypothetical protein LL946_10095 [Knoellia locipacati]|uniref:hypothetical protein n=1 Tax=Knoellia locipacati TaxID=882824 RepID=UPI00384ED28A
MVRVPVMVAVLLAVGSPTTSVSAAPGDCATATALVKQQLPQRAVALLDSLPAAECAAERGVARSAVGLGDTLAAKAADELTSERLSSAESFATQALKHDSENESAAQTLKTIEDARPWSARLRAGWDGFWEKHLEPSTPLVLLLLGVLAAMFVLARLVALGRAEWAEPGTKPNAWRGWMRVGAAAGLLGGAVMISVGFANVLSESPDEGLIWAGRGLAFVTGVVALVVGGVSRRTWGGALRSWTLWAGLAILAALWADQFWVTLEGSSSWRTPLWLLLALLTAAVGIWLAAWLLATRLRLDIVVKGEDGAASSTGVGTVVALLSELGAERAQGIEVPRGADVTALEGAFSTLPDNAFLRTVKGLLVSLGGVTPWTATVEGGAASRSVSIRRNGHAVDSAVIDVAAIVPSISGEPGVEAATTTSEADSSAAEPDASLRLAAAFILLALAQKHRAIRSGLAGATRWESVGLQYIASSDLTGPSNSARRRALLAAALNRDPANLSAQLAYRHALDRLSDDKDTLRRYREWLAEFEKEERLTRGLKLRATYTRAVIATNEAFAGGSRAGGLQPIREALEDHAEIAATVKEDDPEWRLVQELKDRLSGLHYLANGGQRPSPRSPWGMYNLGCALASRHDLSQTLVSPGNGGKAQDDAEAAIWLRRAQEDPLDRDWYKSDPQLEEFRKRAFFRRTFLPAPNSDLFAVPAVAAVAEPLRRAGYGHPRLLAAARPPVVASVAEIDRAQAGVVVRLAEIHCSLVDFGRAAAGNPLADGAPPRPLEDWAGELVHRFVEEGRPSLEHLRGFRDEHARCGFAQLVAADVHATSRTDNELPKVQEGAHWPQAYLAAPGVSLTQLRGALAAWLATL